MNVKVIEKDPMFYKIFRPIITFIFNIIYRPTYIGSENVPKSGKIIIAGNHTSPLDPFLIMGSTKRIVHGFAKIELFKKGIVGYVVRHLGSIPVDRKNHSGDPLGIAKTFLEKGMLVGIFPEGTINKKHETVTLPFKIGAVKACFDTNTKLVPFVITGKYNIFGKGVKIEFLKPMSISEDLDKENNKLMKIISKKVIEGEKNVK